MTFWALVFVAVFVGAHATRLWFASGPVSGLGFTDCASNICALKKSGRIQDSDKAILCLILVNYDFDNCALPPPSADQQSMPKCDGPNPPNDVTLTCAKKNKDGNWLPNPKCYNAQIGFATSTDCLALFGKLSDFISQSDKDCGDGGGRRRRRSAAVPGFGFSF